MIDEDAGPNELGGAVTDGLSGVARPAPTRDQIAKILFDKTNLSTARARLAADKLLAEFSIVARGDTPPAPRSDAEAEGEAGVEGERSLAAALAPFGWTCGPDFWKRYYTDAWVFNLANAVERLSQARAAVGDRQEEKHD